MKKIFASIIVIMFCFAALSLSFTSTLCAQETVEITKTPVPVDKKSEDTKKKKEDTKKKKDESSPSKSNYRAPEPAFKFSMMNINIGAASIKNFRPGDTDPQSYTMFNFGLHINPSNHSLILLDLKSYTPSKKNSYYSETNAVKSEFDLVSDLRLRIKHSVIMFAAEVDYTNARPRVDYNRYYNFRHNELSESKRTLLLGKLGFTTRFDKNMASVAGVAGYYFVNFSGPDFVGHSIGTPAYGADFKAFFGRSRSENFSLFLGARYISFSPASVSGGSGWKLRSGALGEAECTMAYRISANTIINFGVSSRDLKLQFEDKDYYVRQTQTNIYGGLSLFF